ncbi:head-tail adaptor protein [Acuticoccus sediminis]|uniref:head-tail adaptor protein n=1 Tax=Acuticoccus sediminis TaxID=2184697 RepID=UPI001CFDA96E|nr:head-tail adaptor protein [Acuticoccus sediminis]
MARKPLLRETVRIERRGSAGDGYGNVTAGWETLVPIVYAEVKPMRGREEVLAGKLAGTAPLEVRFRWRPDLALGAAKLTTDDRLVNVTTGDTYNIRSIENPDMKRQWLLLTCETGVAD